MNRRDFLSRSSIGAAAAFAAGIPAVHAAEAAKPFVKPDCPVIDMRLRPRYKGFSEQYTPAAIESCCRKAGFSVPESVKKDDEALMLKEMDEAGITMGMALKRNMTPEALLTMQDHYKNRIRSFCVIDASDPIAKNIEIVEKWAVSGKFRGIYMEAGRARQPTMVNDPKLFPIYEIAQKHNLVVGLMTGGNNSPNVIRSTDHSAVVDCAANFPKVQFLMSHGGWPQVQEILGIAYWYENVWIEADMYMFGGCPGWREYVDAANGYLQDRFMYGSSYPLLPFRETVAQYREFFPNREVYEKVMYKNAARLLNIEL